MSFELPKNKIPATTQDPKNLVLFGLPKVGKTTILSTLDNCLILDFEEGSDYVDALKIKIDSMSTLKNVCAAIREANKPYKFIAIDTITALEEFAKPIALKLWEQSPSFTDKYGKITDVTVVPNGAGYGFIRTVVEKIIDMISAVTDNVIIVGHVKDAKIDESLDGQVKDLDLTGKLKRIIAAKSDAIGFVRRDEQSNLRVNFGLQGEILCGARPVHLANNDIIVAERQEDGSFVSHWERIYPSLA